MLKNFYSLVPLFFFLASCTGGPRPAILSGEKPAEVIESSESILLSAPSAGGLVFFGITGKRSNPQETVKFALEAAARRVAVFHEVSGEYLAEHSVGSGAFDYSSNVQTALYYDEEGAAQYVDALSFNPDTDTFEMDNTLIVRTTYQAALPYPVDFRPVYRGADKKPDWVDNPPVQIGNYEVGIGYAGRHSTLTETFRVSYNNAIFAIIRNLSVTSRNSNMLYQGDGLFSYKTANDHLIYASGSLSNFYVLDAWIDPGNRSIWTLAIAGKSE